MLSSPNATVGIILGKQSKFVWKRERESEREREWELNSELYYTRIKILGSCLFLQSVPANLQANRLHIKQ